MAFSHLRSIANAIGYLFTRRHLLEGRYQRLFKRYHNWDSSEVVKSPSFLSPRDEPAIVQAIRGARRVGIVGAGHSFNRLHLDRDTLISLDDYAKLIEIDPERQTARFQAGARARDVTRLLFERGLALPMLPDHNAQSLAGLLATDVHASGNIGFVSKAVLEIKLIDGTGQVHVLKRGDPLFRATVGGMGCTGIVTEVLLQCRSPFRLMTRAFRCSWADFWQQLPDLRSEYDLVAAGYFPALGDVLVEVKKETTEPLTPLGPAIETARHVAQAIAQTLALPLYARGGFLGELGGAVLRLTTKHLREHSKLVLESYEGFNRNVYQIHKEAEFTLPLDQARGVMERGIALMHESRRAGYYLLGLRVTPGNEETLVGPGAVLPGRAADEAVAWVAPHMDGNVVTTAVERQWGALVRADHGRPHYGKNLFDLTADHVADEHGQCWLEFLAILEQVDPQRKFENALVHATRGRLTKPPLGGASPANSGCVGGRTAAQPEGVAALG